MMGKIKASIEVTNESLKLAPKDWEVHYTKGMCYFNLKDYETAMESFQTANSISRHELTYTTSFASHDFAIDSFSLDEHSSILALIRRLLMSTMKD